MKTKALVAFRSKLVSPCRKLLRVFRFKFKIPVFIRALRQDKPRKRNFPRTGDTALLSGFQSLRPTKQMDRLVELRSLSNKGLERVHFPSPLTPAYLRASRARRTEPSANDEVEDACRSFENYLVDVIVEERKTRDLMDVEELLYCWKNLNCPVFKDLVCRFYGELCKDLFLPADNNDSDSPK